LPTSSNAPSPEAIRSNDWMRVIVNHYHDDAMEEARVEVVRLIAIKANGDPQRLTAEDAGRLRAAAAAATLR
jgi:hypothetical protein